MKIVISIALDTSIVQKLELGSDKYANCITTVSKDSMILEKETNEENTDGSDGR